jgi:hypothetical protein
MLGPTIKIQFYCLAARNYVTLPTELMYEIQRKNWRQREEKEKNKV